VPIVGDNFPGIPARGRGAAHRTESCWLSIAKGLTPRGLRHSHKTMMEEFGVPAKLQDDRMGHADGSVQARYSHITAAMRQQLLANLTEQWEVALQSRRVMASRSPVHALNKLLQERCPSAE
jgi:integrase